MSSNDETFQIVIEPERDGRVRVDAHLIENFDDEEAHFVWEVPVSELSTIIAITDHTIMTWFHRNDRRAGRGI